MEIFTPTHRQRSKSYFKARWKTSIHVSRYIPPLSFAFMLVRCILVFLFRVFRSGVLFWLLWLEKSYLSREMQSRRNFWRYALLEVQKSTGDDFNGFCRDVLFFCHCSCFNHLKNEEHAIYNWKDVLLMLFVDIAFSQINAMNCCRG